jgi:hypothetical protein
MAGSPAANSVTIGIITAGLTTAVTAISVLTQWRAYSRALHDHSQEIQQDLQVVQYWEEWLKVRTSCAADDGERAELNRKVRTQLDSLPLYPTRELLLDRIQAPRLFGQLFLVYPPRHKLAWIPRAIYYLLLVLTTYVFVAAGFVVPAALSHWQASMANQAAGLDAWAIGAVALIALAFVATCLVVRYVVEWLDGGPPSISPKPRRKTEAVSGGNPAEVRT